MASPVVAFLIEFVRDRPELARERELVIEVDGERRSASLYLPGQGPPPHPAWILLQGVTVPGRFHSGVRRMARALAAAGHLVLVPEVPSWTNLRVRPREAMPTVRGGLAFLGDRPDVDPRRLGLMAFSVAGTWALEAAAQLPGTFRAVVAMAAYGDLRHTMRSMVVAEYEWKGRVHHYPSNPYGRWILGADLLPDLVGDEYGTPSDRKEAARALHRLATTAGRNGAHANEPVFDPLIRDLRAALPPDARRVWDLLAPTSDNLVPDPAAGRVLANALTDAGLRRDPTLSPVEWLTTLKTPVILVHGRHDDLIPYVEALRLAAALPPGLRRSITITDLIGHAKLELGGLLRNPFAFILDLAQFARLVQKILNSL